MHWGWSMRKTCIDMIHVLAKRDPRVVFIGSDLSPGLLGDMKAEMPSRHYMEGVAEMNVVGIAAGMALDGYMPYVNTIATFLTRRCYEQVALDVCLHHLPVRLVANGGGVVYAPLGPTHLAVEDFAIMCALPNMTVVAVSDHEEMKRFMDQSLHWPDPIYIRLGKGGDPVISDPDKPFAIGKGIMVREDLSPRVLIVSTGVMSARCLEAAGLLAARGCGADVLHMHTVKPLDRELLIERSARVEAVISVEEHTVIGGLGSAVIDCLVGASLPRLPKMKKLGLPDMFMTNYGVQDDLLEIHGLQPPSIAQSVLDFL